MSKKRRRGKKSSTRGRKSKHSKLESRLLRFESLEDRRLLAGDQPRLIHDFAGISYADNTSNHTPGQTFTTTPADASGAVGKTHVVGVVNSSIQWSTKDGKSSHQESLSNFFKQFFAPNNGNNNTTVTNPTTNDKTVGGMARIFDPRAIYDPLEDRFVVVALSDNLSPKNTNSHILIAVSETEDPTKNWHFAAIPTNEFVSGSNKTQVWADFPGIALDEEALYITANLIDLNDGSLASPSLWVIAKDRGGTNGTDNAKGLYHKPSSTYPAWVRSFDLASVSGITPSTSDPPNRYQPASVLTEDASSVSGIYMVDLADNLGGTTEKLRVVHIMNPLGTTPMLSGQEYDLGNISFGPSVLGNTSRKEISFAPQLNVTDPAEFLAPNGDQVFDVVWRDNALWGVVPVVTIFKDASTFSGKATLNGTNVVTLPSNTVAPANVAIGDTIRLVGVHEGKAGLNNNKSDVFEITAFSTTSDTVTLDSTPTATGSFDWIIGGNEAGQASAQWFHVNQNTNAVQTGVIGGEDIAPGTHVLYPSLAVHPEGNVGISYIAAGPTMYASAYVTGLTKQANGTYRQLNGRLLKSGVDEFHFISGSNPRNRIGDYTATSLDPSTGHFWSFNIYADTSAGTKPTEMGRWATQWGEFAVGAALGNELFVDINEDGVRQSNEPGLPGAKVHLYEFDGTLPQNPTTVGNTTPASGEDRWLATMETNDKGEFEFPELLVGVDYYLKFDQPANLKFTAKGAQSDPMLDSNVSAAGLTDNVQPSTDIEINHSFDAGVVINSPTVQGQLFEDLVRDDKYDVAKDSTVRGRTIYLYEETNNGAKRNPGAPGSTPQAGKDKWIATTQTDANGEFLFFAEGQKAGDSPSTQFTPLDTGIYYVQFSRPEGTRYVLPNVGNNDALDSEVLDERRGYTHTFSLTPANSTNPGTQVVDIDAGVYDDKRNLWERLRDWISRLFDGQRGTTGSGLQAEQSSELAALTTQLGGIAPLVDIIDQIPGVDFSSIERILDQLQGVARQLDNLVHEKPELTGANVAPTTTSSESKFLLRLDEEEPVEVSVPATSNVVAAVNAALVAAGFVDDNSAPILNAALDGSGQLKISVVPDDRAKAITASTLRLTAANPAPAFGQTTAPGTVELKVTRTRPNGSGGTTDEDETLSFLLGTTPAASNQEPFPFTNDNANVQELADDVNLGFAQVGLFSVKALVDNGKLVIAATDPEVTKIELLQGAGILNFGSSVSATATGNGPLGLGAGTRGLPVLKFSTVQGLVTELNNALSAISGQTFSANAVHDTQTNSILFDFNLDVDFLNQAIDLDFFDGIDLGPFELELAAIADASIDVGIDLQTRMGISLDPAGSDFTLDGSTLLSEINGGDGVGILVGMTATNPTPAQGQPGNDVSFTITVDREGTTSDSTHSLVLLKNKDNAAPLKPSTGDNTDATSLVDDLNRLFEQEGLESVVEAGLVTDKDSNGQVTAQRIYLTALDPLATSMTLSGPDLSLLGFVGTTVSSNYPDLVLQVGSALPVDVVLDGVETIQHVLDRISTASSGAITAAVGGDDNISLFSSQEFTLIPAMVPTLFEASVASTTDALTSRAGISLGILGESDGGVLEGAALHGEGVDDLIFLVEQPLGQQNLELSLALSGNLDLGAAIGPLGLSLTTPTPVTFDVTSGIRLVDPNADDGLIHLSEIFAAPNDVFDFSGLTPTFQGSGSFELSASFLGGTDDNANILGDVLGTTTNPTITVDIMADNNGFDFEINENLSQISLKDMLEQLKEVSPEQIITLIGDMVQQIKENPDLPFLNKKLPVIDKSLNEIVDFADALIVGIEKVINNIDLDVLGDAVEDLDMAINNIALPQPVKAKLLRVVDVLRRISGDLDPAQLADEFNSPTDFARRLPTRLLSAVIQAGKEIQAALATIPGSVTRPVAGELVLEMALAKLAELVPGINTIEARIEDSVSESIANALQIPQNDVQFKIGFVSDYDSSTPLTKQRALVVGLSIDVTNLSLQFDPQFPSTDFGPIELQLQTMFDLYAGAEIDLGLGVTLESNPKLFVVAEPPSSSSSDFDDDLVKTKLGLTAGFAGNVEGNVKFGSLDVITATGELDLLTSLSDTDLTIDGLNQVALQAAPVDGDRRFVVVAVDGNVVDVESFEVSGNTITFVNNIPTTSQSIDVHYQSATTPPPAPTSGPDLRAMTKANRAALDVTFDDTTSFVNTIGAIEFGDLGNNVELDAQGLLIGSVGAEFLGKEVSDAATLALSLNHPLDPQLTVDTDVLTDLLEGVDFDLKTILVGIEAFLDSLEEGLTEDVLARLPIVGDGFDADETFIGRLRDDFVTPLRQFLCDVGGSLEEVRDFIEIEVFRLLGPGLPSSSIPAGLGILEDRNNDNIIDLDDVDVELTLENFMIAVSIGGEDKVEVDFDSGLAGLPIVADAQGGVELGWEYTIDLGFGVDRYQGFYLVTNSNSGDAELRLENFGAQLIVDTTSGPEPIPTSLTVDLLGLKLSATDQLTSAGAAGTAIGGSLLLDMHDPDDDMRLFVSEITNLPFKDLFSVDFDAGVSIDLLLEAGINDTLPSMQAELIVDWSASLDILNGQATFSSTGLNVGFENIGINLGDFLSRHLGTAVKQITKFIEPIEPVIRALKQEVPGVSAISQAKGNGPVTFLDLALLRVPDKAEQARKFVDAIDTLLEISRSLESVDPDALVFVLQEEFALIQGGSNELDDPAYSANVDTDQLVQNNPAQEEPTEEATGGIRALLQKIEDLGINLHFLETKNLINFLLKRPFDVISYELPRFELPFTFEKSFPVWTPPKIDVRVGLDANIFADLSVGYDSHGLDTGRFFDGFYFGDREDVFVGADIDEFGLGLGVRLAALLDIVVASAGVEGEIRGDVLANWRDLDDDGKLHLDELTQIVRHDGVECLFDLRGELSAIVRLVWEVLGKEGSKELFNKVLFEFANECPHYELGQVAAGGEALPGGPNATAATGTLILHAGAFASERRGGATSDIAEEFTVKQLAPGVFQVNALELESRYSGVTQIFFDGGLGNDKLILDGVDVPVVALGGPGHDILFGTQHADYLDGGEGNDELYARGGSDTVFGGGNDDLIYGDLAPSDTSSIWGTGAMDTIDGGSGVDTIHAAEGDDMVMGGAGNDEIHGDAGADTIHAGSGNDTVYGGDQGDFIFGDAGNDALFGQGGNDEVEGGTGSDLVMGHAGNDLLQGNSGIDVLIGGLGEDDLFGQQGNDALLGGLATANSDHALVVGAILPLWLAEITSQEMADVIAGTPDSADELWGGVDNDLLIGDDGADQQYGGWGNDVILAHQINLQSTMHAEYIEGGPGDDFICGAEGVDTIFGGTADPGLAHILSEMGATPTLGGFSLLSCIAGEVFVEPPPITSSLTGVKFHDLDGDAVRQDNEPVLEGWTILLLDGTGEVIASTETDENGAYLFDQLTPGDYTIAEQQQTDWLQTTADHQIALLVDQNLTDLDFGNQFNGAELIGQKWHDLNGDGTRDSNELGLNGWQIVLTDAAGTEFIAVTADVDLNDDQVIDPFTERGVYRFVDLPSGEYTLREIPKASWIQSAPQLASSDVFAPIADDGYSQTRSDRFVDSSAAAGLIQTIDVSVQVEHARLSDLSGFLVSPSGTRVDLTEFVGGPTDPLNVLIGEPAAGVWTLSITDNLEGEAGKLLDWQILITTATSSPPPLEGGTPSVFSPGRTLAYDLSLAAGDVLTRDFGNYQPASVEGTKYVDRNGNGVRDLDDPVFPDPEPGLAGVVIYADLNNNGLLDRGEPSTTTSADDPDTLAVDETGQYSLSPLPPRTSDQSYAIREVLTGGYTQTFPADGGHSIAPQSGETIEMLDFGNAPPASVHGEKWIDENMNGMRDESEPGLAGVIIYADLNNNSMRDPDEPSTITMSQAPALLVGDTDGDLDVDLADFAAWQANYGTFGTTASSGDFSGNDLTDGFDFILWQRQRGTTIQHKEGSYWLDGIPMGVVTIREVVPVGFERTFPFERSHTFFVAPGEVINGIDFGNGPLDGNFGSIHGTKWHDQQVNGVRDQGELGIAGVEIYLDLNNSGQHESGEPLTVTAADDPATPEVDEAGRYWFAGLGEGEYVVREIVPIDAEQVYPGSGVHVIRLGQNERVEDIDFGNWLLPEDTGGDGDGDGDVDQGDLMLWRDNYGDEFSQPSSGNFDGDTVTSGADFLHWQSGFTGPVPLAAGLAPPGLVALWDFEQNLTDTAADYVQNVGGFSDDVSAFPNPPGAIYAPGLVGASAAELQVANTLTTTATGDLSLVEFSLELFVFPDPLQGGIGTIVRSVAQSIPAGTTDFRLSSNSGSVQLEVLQGNSIQASTGLHALTPNSWSHVAIVSLAAGELQLFVNGAFADVIITPGTSVGIDANDLIQFGGREFSGLIDKAAVWDFPLSDFEIQDHAANPQDCYGLTPITTDTGKIHGHKFADTNGNGVWDSSESPLENWVIEITGGDLNQDGTIDSLDRLTTVTNAMGEYWFMDLLPALYTISEIQQTGWTQTTTGGAGFGGNLVPQPGTTDWTIDLVAGEEYFNVDFGNQQDQPGKIHGHKFEDTNGNGVWDNDEQPLENWVIEITGGDFNGDGMIDLNDRLTTVTNAMGEYWFMGLLPGLYTIREIQQLGWTQTTIGGMGFGGSLVPQPGTIEWTIDLAFGEEYFEVDFGNQRDLPPIPLPDGDDIIYASGGDDVQVYGDNLVSNPMIVSVGTRRDTIFGEAGNDQLFGQEEDDILWGAGELLGVVTSGDDDMLDGGDGIDEVRQTVDADQTLTDNLLTGQGNDQLVSIERATLTGGASANTIDATAFTGPVSLFGLDGDDVLRGGFNDDQLDGGGGSDDLFGNAGNDRYLFTPVTGVAEIDTVEELAGQGTDTVDFSSLNHSVTVDLLGGLPGDRIAQEPGLVRIVNVLTSGNEANFENIVGTEFDDTLIGNNAANVILARGGSDSIDGGAGSDILDLGLGINETAQGGIGDDLFLFADGWGTTTLADSGGVDAVDLSAVTQPLLVEIGSLTVTQGANTITHLSNDLEHVVGGQADDIFRFISDGSSLPAAGTIDGRAGTNWLDYIGYTTTSANVDLSVGTAQGIPGGISNIVNVLGGAAGEMITGDGSTNLLDGRGGADTIVGLGGDDLIIGGAGDDLLLDGGAGSDVYRILDNEGNDNIADSGPASDNDVLDLSAVASDLLVNIQAAQLTADNVTYSHQITSTIAIEEILTGSGQDTVFFHGTAALPGTSKINAGDGDDTLNYSNYALPVSVNLSGEDHPAPPAIPTVPAGTVTGVSSVSGFVNVIGSAQNDVILGNSDDNRLEGLAGDDELFGLQGDDTILGGIGTNTMTGGGGNDLYIIDPSPNSLIIVEQTGTASSGFASNGGIDTIDFSAVGVPLNINIASNPELENILGSSTQPNILIGNENSNLLVGGNQSDRIEGGGGNDLLVGLGAADWVVGGAGNDVLLGGSGDDGTGLDGTNPRVFVGGTGRDIVVGGAGQDRIDADDDEEDIVIDGTTAYENVLLDPTHRAAWETLLDVWQSTSRTRAMRESLISNGVGSSTIGGPFQLDGTTVFSDGDADNLIFDAALTSNGVDDWVFAEVGDIQIPSLIAGDSDLALTESERTERSLTELLGVQGYVWSSDFFPNRRSGYIVRDQAFEDLAPQRANFEAYVSEDFLSRREELNGFELEDDSTSEATLDEGILASVFSEL